MRSDANRTVDGQSTLVAEAAAFTSPTSLFLAGVGKSVPLSIQSAAGRRTSRYPLADFVSSQFADSSGQWMGHPQAVLHAAVNGSTSSKPQTWVLELSWPRYNATGDTLSFTVQVLGPGATARYSGGAVAYALANADGSLAVQPAVDTVLVDVVIFIDDAAAAGSARTLPYPSASAKGPATSPSGPDTVPRVGTKLDSVALTSAYQPNSFGGLAQPTGPAPPAAPVSTSASTLNGGGLLSQQNSTADNGGGGGGGGLITGGTATINSVSVYGRTSYCLQLGFIYVADPFRCTPFYG